MNRIRNEKSKLAGYTPHFTIGYKDLTTVVFPEIMRDYNKREFVDSFICGAIYLWKHDGVSWKVQDEFTFNSNVGRNEEFDQLKLF